MVTIFRLITTLGLYVLGFALYAWDANGHVLICRLAYQQMTPETKRWLNQNLGRIRGKPMPRDLDSACIWLDRQRQTRALRLALLHYIDLPYGDPAFYRSISDINAVTAIVANKQKLRYGGLRPAEQRKTIKILLHVIADLHQPMHAITYYSKDYPRGDHGGNFVKISQEAYHGNLHHFWDAAGGLFRDLHWQDETSLEAEVNRFQMSLCSLASTDLNPEHWANESYLVAQKYAYFPPADAKQFKNYQHQVQIQSKRQILKAACHLALVMNQLHP